MPHAKRATAAVAGIGLALLLGTSTIEASGSALVQTDGQCLRLRETPSPTSALIDCLANGSVVTLGEDSATVDDTAVREVSVDGQEGWVEAEHLLELTSSAFAVPPPGGVTGGEVKITSIDALVAAQAFEVASLSVFDVDAQEYLVYVPGAPAFVNTLSNEDLEVGELIVVRRTGTFDPTAPVPIAGFFSSSDAPAVAFATPPEGGITSGLSRTESLNSLVRAQRFEIDSISAWNIGSQRWLVYIPGAPSAVNTLNEQSLSGGMPVFIRRAGGEPEVAVEEGWSERITYYFCQRGANPAGWGDGGGFCGYMRNGERVHEGGAACSPEFYGTQFRIEGDPNDRIYTCTDTGGGVGSGHRDVWFQNSDNAYHWWLTVGSTAVVIPVP